MGCTAPRRGAELAVHDRRDRTADQHPRVADAHRGNSRDGARRHGDGKSSFVGVVYCRDLRDCHRVRRSADRRLGSLHVRSLVRMSARNAGLTADLLFVGATRPPMRWGVTYAALLFNMVITMEAFLVTRNLITLLICAPIHGICALLCARDARFFDLILLWGRTRLP